MKKWSTMDAFKAGWLKYNGHSPTMAMRGDSTVIFMFSNSKEIQRLIRLYEDRNTTVNLSGFVKSVKDVKTDMHTCLLENRNGKD